MGRVCRNLGGDDKFVQNCDWKASNFRSFRRIWELILTRKVGNLFVNCKLDSCGSEYNNTKTNLRVFFREALIYETKTNCFKIRLL